jgi:hypothetical protein
VTGGMNHPNQLRIFFGKIAQDKKGGLYIMSIQYLEDFVAITLDS